MLQESHRAPIFYDRAERSLSSLSDPLIARSSILTLRAHDFGNIRDSIDRLLTAHRGYTARMETNTPDGAPRWINSTLRVPAAELEATLAALETLGSVLSESKTGEEVTQQSRDLDARLANARNAEQRLTTLLKEHTGTLSDVLAVEEKIDATRLEIEKMVAERKSLTNRIEFATIDLHVVEEYKARVEGTRSPVSTVLRDASINGVAAVSNSLVGGAAVLLSAGPVLLVWIAILFFPARFAYRRLTKGRRPK
jgi:Domain of unknown function (DUF4349)